MRFLRSHATKAAALLALVGYGYSVASECGGPIPFDYAQCGSGTNCMSGAYCYAASGTCSSGAAFARITRTPRTIRYCYSMPYANQTCYHDDRPCASVDYYAAGGMCVTLACSSTTVACGCG